MSIEVKKSMFITIEGDADIYTLKRLISLGDSGLDDVDKDSWGEKLPQTKEFASKLLKIITAYERL